MSFSFMPGAFSVEGASEKPGVVLPFLGEGTEIWCAVQLRPALAEPGPRKKGSCDFCAFLRRPGISKGNDSCNLCPITSFSQRKKIEIILEALTLEIEINNLKMPR